MFIQVVGALIAAHVFVGVQCDGGPLHHLRHFFVVGVASNAARGAGGTAHFLLMGRAADKPELSLKYLIEDRLVSEHANDVQRGRPPVSCLERFDVVVTTSGKAERPATAAQGRPLVNLQARKVHGIKISPHSREGFLELYNPRRDAEPLSGSLSGIACEEGNLRISSIKSPRDFSTLYVNVSAELLSHHVVSVIEGFFSGFSSPASSNSGPARKGGACGPYDDPRQCGPVYFVGEDVRLLSSENGPAFYAKAGLFLILGLVAGGGVGFATVGGEILRLRRRLRLAFGLSAVLALCVAVMLT